MGNLAELRKEFMKGLGQRLEPLSLQYSATHQDYSRKFDLGKQSFHISFVNHQSRFAVVADIGIRFDDVEKIRMFNKACLSSREKCHTYSLGAELGNIINRGQLRWYIEKVEDVNPAVDGVLQCFMEVGYPALERYSDPAKALNMLQVPGGKSVLAPIREKRLEVILCLLNLLGRKEEFEAEVLSQREYYASSNERPLSKFEQMVSDLRNSTLFNKYGARPFADTVAVSVF